MGLMNMLPGFMKTGGDAEPAQGAARAPASPTTSTPAPITGAPVGNTMQVVSSYGTPPHDQVLTDKLIGMVTETVPAIKDLLAEAEKIKALEPDLGKRLNMVMTLKGLTAAQASDAVVALTRALENVQRQSESEVAGARTEQVERPRQRVTDLGTQRQRLVEQIAGIDQEVSTTNGRASQAEARIQTEQAKLQASATAAKAWIDSLARIITRT